MIPHDRLSELVESKEFEQVKESISKAVKGVPVPTIGACSAKGAVKFQNFTIVEKEGEFPELLGSFDLGEGIPINEPAEKVHETLEAIVETMGQDENVTVVDG